MEIKTICSLRGIKTLNTLPLFKYDKYTLTHGASARDKIFPESIFKEYAGNMIFQACSQFPFFYSIINDGTILQSPNQHLRESLDAYIHIAEFISNLWFIKDNGAFVHITISVDIGTKNGNYRFGNDLTDCQGTNTPELFTDTELVEAAEVTKKIRSFSRFYDNFTKLELPLRLTQNETYARYLDYNWTNRIDRALNFLSMARGQSLLPVKISFYIPIYESLFSTKDTEITHQVSERVAFYIGGNDDEKSKNYKTIKHPYNIRSRFFHGEKLNTYKLLHEQKKLSSDIDSLTRQVLKKIIEKDSDIFLVEKKLEEFLQSLLFPNKSPIV